MKLCALLLVASLLLAGCRAAPPPAPDTLMAHGRATFANSAEFLSEPAT